MDLSVELDRRGDRTSAIYRACHLPRAGRGDGRRTLRSGDRLPSTRKLAADLAVSRTTVETAYAWWPRATSRAGSAPAHS